MNKSAHGYIPRLAVGLVARNRFATAVVILREPEGRVELFVVEARSAEHQKAPQAGSHKSLMFLTETEELFYRKGCKFTPKGVDQTRRRPLTVLLFRNCCKRNCISKDNGQFQKAKLRRARRCSRVWSHCSSIPRLLRVTTKPTPTVISELRFACKPELKDDG